MMRELFPGYFRPTQAEFESLWNEGLVAVDANILLHFYRYSPALRDTLFDLLEKLGDRLWVPHRVAYEFSKNRLKVIASQEKAYDEACDVLEKLAGTIKSELPPRHPAIAIDEIKARFLMTIRRQQAALKEQKERHPHVPDDDPTLARISELLKGRIGDPDSPEREPKIIEEGERRNKAKIPPGFRDASKDEDSLHRFGDFIAWRQLLEHAKASNARYLLFATDDSSDDWWWKHDGKTIGPHPSLIHEAQREAQCRAYLYRGDQFIRYGSLHFGLKADKKLIEEAATVRRQLRSRSIGVRVIPSFQVRDALASFGRVHDLRVLNDLASRIYLWQRTRAGREQLDDDLRGHGLPECRDVLSTATDVHALRRGRLSYRDLLKLEEASSKEQDAEQSLAAESR
jgi:hypothetical protein